MYELLFCLYYWRPAPSMLWSRPEPEFVNV
jgi:hypothetical protein